MSKKTIIILSSSIALVIVLIIVLVIIFSNSGNNPNQINNTNEEIVAPTPNATITQGTVPQNSLVSSIPPITIGTVGDVIESSKGVSITVLNLDFEQYQYYISLTQQSGFVYNIDTTSSVNTVIYSAKNANNILLRTSYSVQTRKMSLAISQE